MSPLVRYNNVKIDRNAPKLRPVKLAGTVRLPEILDGMPMNNLTNLLLKESFALYSASDHWPLKYSPALHHREVLRGFSRQWYRDDESSRAAAAAAGVSGVAQPASRCRKRLRHLQLLWKTTYHADAGSESQTQAVCVRSDSARLWSNHRRLYECLYSYEALLSRVRLRFWRSG